MIEQILPVAFRLNLAKKLSVCENVRKYLWNFYGFLPFPQVQDV